MTVYNDQQLMIFQNNLVPLEGKKSQKEIKRASSQKNVLLGNKALDIPQPS